MIDKILRVNEFEAVIYYTHRSPVGLYSSTGEVEALIDMILAPIGHECKTLSEYLERVKIGSEDTVVIYVDDVA